VTIGTAIFEADIAEASGDLCERITFNGDRRRAPFSVIDALVGDVPVSESGRLDGDLDVLTVSIVVRKSASARAPFIGELVTLASGRKVRIRSISEDPSGAAYPIEATAETNA